MSPVNSIKVVHFKWRTLNTAFGHGEYPDINHPAFKCVGNDGHGCTTTERDENVPVEYNFENPRKGTSATIPNGGFVIVRFIADNPGLWLFHCHTFSHLLEGQSVLLDVSDKGVPPVPPNFPTCPIHDATVASNATLVDLSSIGTSNISSSTACIGVSSTTVAILLSISVWLSL